MKIEGFAIVSQGSPLARVRFGLLAFDAGDVSPEHDWCNTNVSERCSFHYSATPPRDTEQLPSGLVVLSTSAPSIKYAQLNISGVQFVIRTGAGK